MSLVSGIKIAEHMAILQVVIQNMHALHLVTPESQINRVGGRNSLLASRFPLLLNAFHLFCVSIFRFFHCSTTTNSLSIA